MKPENVGDATAISVGALAVLTEWLPVLFFGLNAVWMLYRIAEIRMRIRKERELDAGGPSD